MVKVGYKVLMMKERLSFLFEGFSKEEVERLIKKLDLDADKIWNMLRSEDKEIRKLACGILGL